MKRSFLIAALLLASIVSQARTQKASDSYTYSINPDDSKTAAREKVLVDMRNRLMSSVAASISDEFSMHSDGTNTTAEAVTEALNAGIVPIKLVKEEFDRVKGTYYVEAEMTYEEDDIKQQLQDVLQDRQRRAEIAATHRQLTDAEAELASMQQRLEELRFSAKADQERCEADAAAAYARYKGLLEELNSDLRITDTTRLAAARARLTEMNQRIARQRRKIDSLTIAVTYKCHDYTPPTTTNANESSTRKKGYFEYDYQGWQLSAGGALGMVESYNGYGIHAGLRFIWNPNIQFGLGVKYFSDEWESVGYYSTNTTSYNVFKWFPIYLDAVFSLNWGGFSFYLMPEAGIASVYEESGYYNDYYSEIDLYLGIYAGVKWTYKRFGIYTQFGIAYPIADLTWEFGLAWRFGGK